MSQFIDFLAYAFSVIVPLLIVLGVWLLGARMLNERRERRYWEGVRADRIRRPRPEDPSATRQLHVVPAAPRSRVIDGEGLGWLEDEEDS